MMFATSALSSVSAKRTPALNSFLRNAFLTLEDNSLIHYYCSMSYDPESERGIRYDDPSFNFQWPAKPEIISEKDLNHPNFIK